MMVSSATTLDGAMAGKYPFQGGDLESICILGFCVCSCATFGILVKPFGAIGYFAGLSCILVGSFWVLESLWVPWAIVYSCGVLVEMLWDSCGVLVAPAAFSDTNFVSEQSASKKRTTL